ncbi:hypothetical protein TL16_g08452 [Triparma laevis f. inornata]|uniref:Phosphodiesterase n=1 Tax=Triparma laevis f. inornata TaxID=1714386 RepID=A0A9W7AXP7_9STRA|nr:hypothetical protein TL16_g08452 [Triparma laevis f. inornata]
MSSPVPAPGTPGFQQNREMSLTGTNAINTQAGRERTVKEAPKGGKGKGGSPLLPSGEIPIKPQMSNSSNTNYLSKPSAYFKRSGKGKKAMAKLEKLIDGFAMQSILGVALIISLFLPDLWIVSNGHEDSDWGIDLLMFIIFISFIAECIALVMTKDDYYNGFFFYMDIVGTLSMILDISWMSKGLGFQTSGDAQLLRAARSAKIGAKSSRLAKLTKLFKLMEQCFVNNKSEMDPTKVPPAKAVARALSGVLSRRVAALVMVLILITPLLQYQQTDNAYEAHLQSFARLAEMSDGSLTEEDWNTISNDFKVFYDNKDMFPTEFSATYEGNTYTYDWMTDHSYIRLDSLINVDADGMHAKVSLRPQLQAESISSILIIILVIIALVGFTASFQHAVDHLVVIPLERMMETLKSSANSILRSVQHIAHEKGGEDEENALFNEHEIDEEVEKVLETDLLENMVAKLARITALVLPGNEQQYVNETNMDQNTKDWIHREYLHEDNKHGRSSQIMSMADAKNIRNKTGGSMPSPGQAGHGQRTTVRKSIQPPGSGGGEESGSFEPKEKDAKQIHREKMERAINSWTYDVEALSQSDMQFSISYIFNTFEILEEFDIPVRKMNGFIKELEKKYIGKNKYHNWKHAVDVMHTVFRFVIETQSHTFFTPLETFAVLISAVAHDLAHPGLSNSFLIKTRHQLAIMHNDQSPLENMHCATLYEIVGKDKYNIFDKLDVDDWRTARKIIISAILGTDMVHHFPLISKLEIFYEMHGISLQKQIVAGESNCETAAGMKETANRSFLIDVFLHAADISNPVKSFDICKKWAYMVVEEFFAQGDLEKERGEDVSPMMDRLTTNIPTMQVSFIEFVVYPLYDSLVKTFPTLEVLLRNIVKNNREWTSRRVEEVKQDQRYNGNNSGDEEIVKLETRLVQLEQKAEKTIGFVLPMSLKLEEAKQQYEDMLKAVASASNVLSSMDIENLPSGVQMGNYSRRRLASGITDEMEDDVQGLEEGDYEPIESGRSSVGKLRLVRFR